MLDDKLSLIGQGTWMIESDAAGVEALGDDWEELVAILGAWSAAVQAAGGYPASGPHDLAGLTSDA